MHLGLAHHRVLLEVVRQTIRRALGGKDERPVDVDQADPTMAQPAGCFVSLHRLKSHRLRGCIGRLDATEPLIHVVRQMAESVLEDPRFVQVPVSLEELPLLEIELTIVSPLRPTASVLEFDLLDEGIYLTCGAHSGCFLPQVARETGWSKEQLLQRLCSEKMGLAADAWRAQGARLHTFSTVIIGPEPFVVAAPASGADAAKLHLENGDQPA